MLKQNIIHKKYTKNSCGYQLVLPLNLEVLIPDDDSVRLLDQMLENLDYSCLLEANSYYGRNLSVSPITLFKIIVYSFSQGIYSSRAIERACKRDVNFKWLLKGAPIPDHNTIWRFVKKRLVPNTENLFNQFVLKLHEMKQVPFENIFVDGTKIEADANRYTFVWRKATEKNEKKLSSKLPGLFEKLQNEYGFEINSQDTALERLKKAQITISNEKELKGMAFVHGKGCRKTQLQRDMEEVTGFLKRQEKYDAYNALFKGRNSFSKTDKDATFMRLKEDHMRNAQLKPAYNIQLGIENEYVVGIYVSGDRNDVNTLKPFINRLEENYSKKHNNIIADAGYESEENYVFLRQNKQKSYIKPMNYERMKNRNYGKKYPGRVENMTYNPAEDEYICAEEKKLSFLKIKKKKSKTGYESNVRIYECEDCSMCSIRGKCTKSKYNKQLQVSTKFWNLREQSLKNIKSKKGIELRINRSIQAEGTIGVLKQDYGFRRFMRRGKKNVKTEMLLLCFGYNINKLHNKIQNERLDQYLHKVS